MQMCKKVLTIIVPTYNMEDYLEKCLNSVVLGEPNCELMLQLEVLVVNDGSTDKSLEIAHGFATKYRNTFKVIDKGNGNYGSCINAALQIATGQYVKILDADDSFDQDAFLSFLNKIKDIQADVILSNVMEVNALGEVTSYKEPKSIEKEKVLPWEAIIPYSRVFMFLHHFTFRRQLLIDIHYRQTENVYYTDLEWVIKPMAQIQTIYYLPVYLYKYLLGRSGQSMDLAVQKKSLSSYLSVLLSLGDFWVSFKGDERRKMIIYTAFIKQLNLIYRNFALLKYYNWSEFRKFDDQLIEKIPQVIDETNKLIIIGGRVFPMAMIKLWREKHYLLFLIARLRYKILC